MTHLLAADNALDEQFQCGVYLALCGQSVPRSDLLSGQCPEAYECDPALYCPQCARRAADSSAEPRPGPGAQEDNRREAYYIGACGHRLAAESAVDGLLFRIGACHECDEVSL